MDPSGPVVVAIGGGHGLSATLRAVRRYASKVTGIVSVADDGGSSGRLRERIPDLPAPGDVRKCLGALASEDEPFARILEHRIGEGDLEGHAVGNLVLTALTFELGSFQAAVDEVGARVGAVGRVLPATRVPVELIGTTADGARVCGQVAVHETPGVERLELEPPDAPSAPEVAEAILEADQVLVGPGSLVTSVLAAAIVPTVRDALARTSAQRVHLANLAPQDPETVGMGPGDETALLLRHGVALDCVLVSPDRAEQHAAEAPVGEGPAWLARPVCQPGARVHDPALLADALRWVASQRVG